MISLPTSPSEQDMLPAGSRLRPKHAAILVAAIDQFGAYAIENSWNTTCGAAGNCCFASEDFMDMLGELGLPKNSSKLEWYDLQTDTSWHPSLGQVAMDRARLPFSNIDGCNFHVAVRIGNVIIDWTARQFDEKAGFPAIWLDEGKKRRRAAQTPAQNRAPDSVLVKEGV